MKCFPFVTFYRHTEKNCYHLLQFSIWLSLKLVSAIFCQIFIFSSNDSPSKAMNFFLFHLKSSFCSQDIQIFVILFLSKLSRFKRANRSGIIYVMNWLAPICRCNFWNNSETALYSIIKLGQIIHN